MRLGEVRIVKEEEEGGKKEASACALEGDFVCLLVCMKVGFLHVGRIQHPTVM